MKWFWLISLGAFAVLSAAAVWMGALNQDEGWYVYAANMVAEGKLPFRDFFFTQGPVMPVVYSAFVSCWERLGLLGARLLTLALGAAGIGFAIALSGRLAPEGKKAEAGLAVMLLLGCNLYHLYYLAIPKTYALASLFVLAGLFVASFGRNNCSAAAWCWAVGGMLLGLSVGVRISLGALLPVFGLWLMLGRKWAGLIGFAVGCLVGLAIAYGPFLFDDCSRSGLFAAQTYHASRGGFDPVWVVGSLSRLVRWYLPVFVVAGIGGFRNVKVLAVAFAAVFAVQLAAPFPYEDYQVPVMALLAVFAAVNYVTAFEFRGRMLLVLGMSFACSFGSPLLEQWSTNGQDRFWSLKKDSYELAQLQDVAKRIEVIDPGGKELLTQDTYLAIETNRKVPEGLEMGPFSMLSDEEFVRLFNSTSCEVAALSGYSFAIVPPKCDERPLDRQLELWRTVKRRYELVDREENFGQNATPLLILKRK